MKYWTIGLQVILFLSKCLMNQFYFFIFTSVRAASPTYHQTVFCDLENYLQQTHVLRRSYVPEKMGVNQRMISP
jgi:hypothetical protein